MASFSYASDSHAVLVGPYGVTQDKRLVDALAAVRTADGIFAMESMTPIRHDPDRAQRLYDFLVRFVAKRNANGDLLRTLHASHPPRQFLSHAPGLYFLDGLTLRELIVTEVTTFYDGESLAVIRELELMRLPIPAAAKPP